MLLSAGARVSADARADAEIADLLDFVGGSGCEMVRNGRAHSADEARAHLERKLDWLRERDAVASAEDFIERAATRSSLSGRSYRVRCEGEPEQPSSDWLLAELERLRAASTGREGSP